MLRRDRRHDRLARRPLDPRHLPPGRRGRVPPSRGRGARRARPQVRRRDRHGRRLPCRDDRIEALRALGTVVWLRGDLGELLTRAERIGGRPMLERSPTEIEALYRAREPYYARAHVTVDTTGLGVDQVVARVLAALRQTHAARV